MASKKGQVIHVYDMSQFPDAVYVGRPTRSFPEGSPWGNPFKLSAYPDRATVLYLYQQMLQGWLITAPAQTKADLAKIAGRPLACWCRHHHAERDDTNGCHADILLDMIEREGIEPV